MKNEKLKKKFEQISIKEKEIERISQELIYDKNQKGFVK